MNDDWGKKLKGKKKMEKGEGGRKKAGQKGKREIEDETYIKLPLKFSSLEEKNLHFPLDLWDENEVGE